MLPNTSRATDPRTTNLPGDSLDLDTDPPDSDILLYKITSTRLFYSRHAVYDNFDGRKWTRSKAKLKITDIEAKDPRCRHRQGQRPRHPLVVPPEDDAPAEKGPDGKELSAEEQANKELAQEKLVELAKRDTGFGPDMRVDYVFNDPPKGRLSRQSRFGPARTG